MRGEGEGERWGLVCVRVCVFVCVKLVVVGTTQTPQNTTLSHTKNTKTNSAEFDVVDVKHGHAADVKALAWRPPAGELLASCSYDDSVKLWASDGDEWACVQTLDGASVCFAL